MLSVRHRCSPCSKTARAKREPKISGKTILSNRCLGKDVPLPSFVMSSPCPSHGSIYWKLTEKLQAARIVLLKSSHLSLHAKLCSLPQSCLAHFPISPGRGQASSSVSFVLTVYKERTAERRDVIMRNRIRWWRKSGGWFVDFRCESGGREALRGARNFHQVFTVSKSISGSTDVKTCKLYSNFQALVWIDKRVP